MILLDPAVLVVEVERGRHPLGEDPGPEAAGGPPRDLADKSIFHRIALVPLLAWVGLGADGLSSSSYGPEEAFTTLGGHTYLAVFLALAVPSPPGRTVR